MRPFYKLYPRIRIPLSTKKVNRFDEKIFYAIEINARAYHNSMPIRMLVLNNCVKNLSIEPFLLHSEIFFGRKRKKLKISEKLFDNFCENGYNYLVVSIG